MSCLIGVGAVVWWIRPVTNISHLGEADCISNSTTMCFQQCTKPSMCGLWTISLCILFSSILLWRLTPHHLTTLPNIYKRSHSNQAFPSQQSCCIHYYHFSDRSSNYHVKVTQSLTDNSVTALLYQTKWCCGLEADVALIHVFSLRQLVKMRPGLEWGEWICCFEAEQDSCQSQAWMGCSYPQPIRELFINVAANQVNSWFAHSNLDFITDTYGAGSVVAWAPPSHS